VGVEAVDLNRPPDPGPGEIDHGHRSVGEGDRILPDWFVDAGLAHPMEQEGLGGASRRAARSPGVEHSRDDATAPYSPRSLLGKTLGHSERCREATPDGALIRLLDDEGRQGPGGVEDGSLGRGHRYPLHHRRRYGPSSSVDDHPLGLRQAAHRNRQLERRRRYTFHSPQDQGSSMGGQRCLASGESGGSEPSVPGERRDVDQIHPGVYLGPLASLESGRDDAVGPTQGKNGGPVCQSIVEPCGVVDE